MSVETETPLTEAAAIFRAAQARLAELEARQADATDNLAGLEEATFRAQADLWAAESVLEDAAADPDAPDYLQRVTEAAAELKAARIARATANDALLRCRAALSDAAKDRLDARDAVARAREALHEEAFHGV